jgi:UDP-2,3-diacylglucosamine pyrophosphatase LpxH
VHAPGNGNEGVAAGTYAEVLYSNLGRGVRARPKDPETVRNLARTRYIVSDLHLGAGDVLDDFRCDREFADFLHFISRRRGAELILNGDFIDFVAVRLEKSSTKPFSRLGCTEEESLRKLEKVIQAHPLCFSALRAFIAGDNRVVLVPGNHDVDLFWPRVRDRLLHELGDPGSEGFYFESSGVYRAGPLHVEHGNQYFADSAFEDFTHPFLRDPKTGELRLERCWGTCFLEYFANGMISERHPFINNVRPIPTMIFLGLQEESWWLKIAYSYKLIRFILKVGFPPFRESRDLLKRLREGRLSREGYGGRRLVGLLSGRGKVENTGFPDGIPAESCPEEEGLSSTGGEAEEGAAGETGARPEERNEESFFLDPLATREDALSVAARRILLSGDGVDVVVFGHDHRYFSNELQPLVGGERGKYYVNTGTWIPMLFLTREARKLRWRDLRDPTLYRRLLTYAEVRKGLVGTTAALKKW